MKKILLPALLMGLLFSLDGCSIETTKKKDGIKIEITTSDDLIINGEKINDKKLDREIKRLIRDLEKEGLSKDEIRKSISEGKSSVSEALEELKQELEELKSHSKQRKELN
ncbi:hypothetical protein J0A68_03025 [Algoriphagus sp. H41]|uniref:Uncharacterized protein n=1 Tax=Algoriphagus oliviformis TaxID=2811231 RepID=A0ABS3C175_9BACT|nr:hypothetical protein [Algoriphagus oliviformis]MBN7809911.1 hypothetical protein [Algoriphagus oliviformis]